MLEWVCQGEEVVIVKSGKPVAWLVRVTERPLRRTSERKYNFWGTGIRPSGDALASLLDVRCYRMTLCGMDSLLPAELGEKEQKTRSRKTNRNG